MGTPPREGCNKRQRLSLEFDQEFAGRADPPNSVSTVSFINAYHSTASAGLPPLYYPIQPSCQFHNLDLISPAVLLDVESL